MGRRVKLLDPERQRPEPKFRQALYAGIAKKHRYLKTACKDMKLTNSHLSRILTGHIMPNMDTGARMAQALEITLDELYQMLINEETK
jgi:transcriptional regulator with XRE-family HTH domain